MLLQNSKPTSSALILHGNKILLGKRKINPAKGAWDVPGGFLELGEHQEAGLKREIREKLGVGVRGYYRKLGYKLQNSYLVKSLV
ncbi:MAG: NUDIX domain-containing protein [Parcubacteria group bacterium]|nr:NUDIX domain-containing protein [Parcubacteria group bacterium]